MEDRKWTFVFDGEPKEGKDVLLDLTVGRMVVGYRRGLKYYCTQDNMEFTDLARAWMPLPDVLEEENA